MKFKPDYDSAASEYERAAVCFKNAKQSDRCFDAYVRAADCHEKNGILFHSAKCRESAAMIAKDMGKIDDAKKLMETAAQQYAETGTALTSAQALEKIASFLEEIDPQKSIEIYQKAFDLVAESDKMRQAADYLNKISKVYLKLEKFSDASTSMLREAELYSESMGSDGKGRIARLMAQRAILGLYQGDVVAARRALQDGLQIQGVVELDEASCINGLINAYEECDEKKFQLCLKQPCLTAMDNQILRLMRNLRLPTVKMVQGDTGATNTEADEEVMDFR